jgi:hypothetical protein
MLCTITETNLLIVLRIHLIFNLRTINVKVRGTYINQRDSRVFMYRGSRYDIGYKMYCGIAE